MSAPKAKDPKMDWGFHAVIPRIVRTEYKDVTPLQKWAYVCLKDLCGETGTCYRTIRVLAQEIGLSMGMTSETIRVLHDAGLIHAEKKKRHTGGKEVWHITIVDIWTKNGQIHPTKRSPAEQECSQYEQSSPQENVHNTNVHRMNEKPRVCSPAEQECSHSETEEESLSRIITEAGSEGTFPREIDSPASGAHAPTPTPVFSHSQDSPDWDRTEPASQAQPKIHIATGTPDEPGEHPGYEKDAEEAAAWQTYQEVAPAPTGVSRALAENSPPKLVTQAGARPPSAHVEPKPLTLKVHTDLAFTWLDAVRKEATGDPLASYVPNGANKKRLADLIEACRGTPKEITEVNVRSAWTAMWNSPKWNNGKSWQDPGMLTVKAFCEHYGDALDQARAARKKQASNRGTPGVINDTQKRLEAAYPLPAQNDNHCLYSDEELQRRSDREWVRIQAHLAKPEVQADLVAKGYRP